MNDIMPYFEPEIEFFLKLINKIELTQSILLKFHSGVNQGKCSGRIKQGIKIVQGDLFDFLVQSRMMIGMPTKHTGRSCQPWHSSDQHRKRCPGAV
jgi:hypothetical protein